MWEYNKHVVEGFKCRTNSCCEKMFSNKQVHG